MTREARTALLKSGLSLGCILPYIQSAHQILPILYQLLFPLCLHCVLHAKLLQSCLTLCNRIDCSPPGSSVHEILQERILEWVAVSFSREPHNPGIKPVSLTSPALAGGFFTTSAT